jgi:hypothetical protein
MNEEELIINFLKTGCDVRLTSLGKWLYWDTGANQWNVYTHLPHKRYTTCLYSGDSLAEALVKLDWKG